MIQQLDFFFYFRKIQKIIFGVFISLGLLFLNSCGEKEDPLPEGFDFVTDFELIPYDSVFVIWQGTHELNLTPKFFGAFGDEITLEFNISLMEKKVQTLQEYHFIKKKNLNFMGKSVE